MTQPINRAEANLEQIFSQLGTIRDDFRNKNMYRLILSFLSGQSLLDIGCGVGHFLNIARQQGFTVAGIEPGTTLIDLAKQFYGDSLQIRNLPAEEIDKIQGVYDNITMIDVLEHIEDDRSALMSLKKNISRDGRLVILVPCFMHLFGQRDRDLGHYRRYEKNELIEKLQTAGYQINQCRFWNMLGYIPYLIAEKILHKTISAELRKDKKKNIFQKIVIGILDTWMRLIENNLNLGFGLSLIVVAQPVRRE